MKTHAWLRDGTHSSAELPAIADWLAKSGLRGGLCDVGCGNGELLRLLSDGDGSPAFVPLIGVDIEPGHCKVARDRAPDAEIICADFTAGKPVAYFFKVIVAVNWLHNCWQAHHATGIPKEPEDPEYLNRFFRVASECLTEDGILVCDWRGSLDAVDVPNDILGIMEWETITPLEVAAFREGFTPRQMLTQNPPTMVFSRSNHE